MGAGTIDGIVATASDGMAIWFALNGRVVVFDTETTGLGEDDEILQLSAIEFVQGVKTRTFNAYIQPVLEHDDIGTGIHGITKKFLRANGRPARDVLDESFGFMGDTVLLVAHNIKFDMGMLQQECALCEDARWVLRQVKTFDTVTNRMWQGRNSGSRGEEVRSSNYPPLGIHMNGHQTDPIPAMISLRRSVQQV